VNAREGARFFVITGGPGAGKTTLIEALGQRGLATMPEAGRAIIQHQLAIGGAALPWADRELFADLMLSWEMRSYAEAQKLAGPVVFDRGVPDVLAYRQLCGLRIPEYCERAAASLRYAPQVFVAPPWREIFIPDAERKQSFAEAEATCQALVQVYSRLNYELIELPRADLSERVEFVCKAIAAAKP
jgi:predicted ATPase